MIGLAHWIRWAPAIAVGLSLGTSVAPAAAAVRPDVPPTEVAQAKRVLEANGYADITVVGGDDRLVTASALKDGQKSLVDVDPMTEIILPHVDLPPIPAQLAPVTGLPKPR